MGVFGFTWSDAGAVVGATVGGAVLGPPGAMLGGALATYAGATLGDGKGAGQALEEAAVAGVGGAGGAWAADLGGKLLRDGIVRVAGSRLSGSAAGQVDRIAAKVLLPWNKYDASPIAALGGGFAAYEASPQSRSSSGSPVAVRVTDIGNGGCPIEMANLVMPEGLSPAVEKLYRELPGYLCGVWRGFGAATGAGSGPVAPKPPAAITGAGRSGIGTYRGKVAELEAAITEFAALDRELAPLAGRSGEISARGRQAVTAVIARVDRGATTTSAPGPAADENALAQLDAAFDTGQSILDEARQGNDRLADRIDALARRIDKLVARVESGAKRIDEVERRTPSAVRPPDVNISNYGAPSVNMQSYAGPPRAPFAKRDTEKDVLPQRPGTSSARVSRAPQVAARVSATPWTPKALPVPDTVSSEPSELRVPGLASVGTAPNAIPWYRPNGTGSGLVMAGPAPAVPIPGRPAAADRPQPVAPRTAAGIRSTPWGTTSPYPAPGPSWIPGFVWRPDDQPNGCRKSGSGVPIAALNSQAATPAWHTCRGSRSPCAECGTR
ncbi:hypothetical protein AB0L57_08765 [Nocardia sp. NPDC052254]|uniref:hypothetical protein n=1 Tax=Nocardia sp. NPDC052254 TaxID=3155681 RepID=UPI00341E3500